MYVCGLSDINKIVQVMRHTGGVTSRKFWKQAIKDPSTYVLMPLWGAVFIIFPITEEVCSGHVYIEPKLRGKKAIEAQREVLKWVVNNTPYKMVVGFVDNKPHIERHHALVGMKKIKLPSGIKMFYWAKEQ